MVFRPAGTPLPPSRGRMAFDLRPDGTFAESGLGATDVPEEATGTWTLDGETLTLSEGAAQGVPREMQVVSLDDDRLILKRREGG
ncbi:lipocalin family protein [Nocardioides sp.]|uniref:lipocalin family protein n=1 Tax=Nocardioides sp. TaxID=35761 RepID=UPI003433C175